MKAFYFQTSITALLFLPKKALSCFSKITSLKILFSILFILFFQLAFTQQLEIKVIAQDAPTILTTLEERLNIRFNYNHEYLPKGTFSFACKGNKNKILRTAFSVLDRNYTTLDEDIYRAAGDALSYV